MNEACRSKARNEHQRDTAINGTFADDSDEGEEPHIAPAHFQKRIKFNDSSSRKLHYGAERSYEKEPLDQPYMDYNSVESHKRSSLKIHNGNDRKGRFKKAISFREDSD